MKSNTTPRDEKQQTPFPINATEVSDNEEAMESDVEPKKSIYPNHSGGERREITLSAIQNDWLIEFIRQNLDRIDQHFDPVADDVLEKLDLEGYNHRSPSQTTLLEAEEMFGRSNDAE